MRSPEQSRSAQNNSDPRAAPEHPRAARSSPEQPRAAQINPEQPRAARSGPEQPETAQNCSVVAAVGPVTFSRIDVNISKDQ